MKTRTKTGLLLAASCLGSVFLILVSTSRYGVGLSPDSVNYISTARSLLSTGSYTNHTGEPYTTWPPFFPTLMASLGLTGFDPLDAARYVNAITFGLIVLVSGFWLVENLQSRTFVVLGCIAIALAQPLVMVSGMAWTEPLFVLFVLLSLFSLQVFSTHGTSRSLFLSMFFAGLASLTRYSGVTAILTGVIVVATRRQLTFTIKFRNATAFALVSISPTLAWLARNYANSGTLTGERGASSFTIQQNVAFTLDTTTAWFLPRIVPATPRVLAVGLLSILAGVLLLRARRRQKTSWRRVDVSRVMPLFSFIAVYTSYLIASASVIAFDRIDDRLLSPVYVPIALVIVFGLANVSDCHDRRLFFKHFRAAIVAGFCLWLVLSGMRTGRRVVYAFQNGAGGYASHVWHTSEVVAYLKERPPDGLVYSNDPAAIYILAGISAQRVPRKHLYNSPGSAGDDLEQFRKSLPSNKGVYVVWFEPNWRRHLYDISELRTILDVEMIARRADGSVYRLK